MANGKLIYQLTSASALKETDMFPISSTDNLTRKVTLSQIKTYFNNFYYSKEDSNNQLDELRKFIKVVSDSVSLLDNNLTEFRNEFNNKLINTQNAIYNKINDVESDYNTKITNLDTKLTNSINNVNTTLSKSISDLDIKLTKKINDDITTLDNKKQNNIIGAATTIVNDNLTANRALLSNGSGKVAVSSVTNTELSYLSGVSSSIQTQLNSKSPNNHTHYYAGSSSVGGSANSAVKLETARAFQVDLSKNDSDLFNGENTCVPGIQGTLGIYFGGTGANNAVTARSNLGLGSAATQSHTSSAPSSGSAALITSGAVYSALSNKQNVISYGNSIPSSLANGEIYIQWF